MVRDRARSECDPQTQNRHFPSVLSDGAGAFVPDATAGGLLVDSTGVVWGCLTSGVVSAGGVFVVDCIFGGLLVRAAAAAFASRLGMRLFKSSTQRSGNF